jgi:hypothetical protein
MSDGLGESLAGLLASEGIGSRRLCVRFREPLAAHSQRLMDALGVMVVIDPDAPILSDIKASGRSGTTRSEMSDELRARQRASYYAREDKQHLVPCEEAA